MACAVQGAVLLFLLAVPASRAVVSISTSDGTTHTFASSLDLRQVPARRDARPPQLPPTRRRPSDSCPRSGNTPGRTLRLLYSLTAGGAITGALVSSLSSSEYAGISLGQAHRSGSPTVIMTQSSIAGYFLNGYSSSTLNAARGSWRLTGTSVKTDVSGSLRVGLFSGSGAPTGAITLGYVFGPASGSTLGDHSRGGWPYANTRQTLVVASVPAPSPPPPAAASPAPPSASPAPPGASPVPAGSPPAPPGGSPADPSDGSSGDGTDGGASPAAPIGQALGFGAWLSTTLSQDGWLAAAFVLGCSAAPGVALLVWPYLYDAVADLAALLSAAPDRAWFALHPPSHPPTAPKPVLRSAPWRRIHAAPAAAVSGLAAEASLAPPAVSPAILSDVPLRDYQEQAIQAVLSKLEAGVAHQLICMPTGRRLRRRVWQGGAGKTVVFTALARTLGRRTLVLAHRTELLEQAAQRFSEVWPEARVHVVQGADSLAAAEGGGDSGAPDVFVASVHTAHRRAALGLLQRQGIQLLIVDECHRVMGTSYHKILKKLGFWEPPDAQGEASAGAVAGGAAAGGAASGGRRPREAAGEPAAGAAAAAGEAAEDAAGAKLLIGFTATPMRTDKRSLGTVFKDVAFECDIEDMIMRGYLVPPKGERIMTEADLTGVRRGKDGEFATKQARWRWGWAHLCGLVERVNTPKRNRLVAQAYQQKAAGRKAIVFCCDVQHALDMAEAFHEAGVSCASVHGSMRDDERAAVLGGLSSGQYQASRVVTNCMVLTEGFDDPSVSAILCARPTNSQLLYIQAGAVATLICVGRGLRPFQGKEECLILDFTDRSNNLNMPISLEQVYRDPGKEREQQQPPERGEPKVDLSTPGGKFNLLTDSKWAWQRYGSSGHMFCSLFNRRSLWLLRVGSAPGGSSSSSGGGSSEQPQYQLHVLYEGAFKWERVDPHNGSVMSSDSLPSPAPLHVAHAGADKFMRLQQQKTQRSAPWRREFASSYQLDKLGDMGMDVHDSQARGMKKGQASNLISAACLRDAHAAGRLQFPAGFEVPVPAYDWPAMPRRAGTMAGALGKLARLLGEQGL
eukprot:scaffold2.g7398.t1